MINQPAVINTEERTEKIARRGSPEVNFENVLLICEPHLSKSETICFSYSKEVSFLTASLFQSPSSHRGRLLKKFAETFN